MKVAVDSCSMILLAKATVLEILAQKYKIHITEEVYKEILQGKARELIDALITEKLVKENKIKIIKTNSNKTKKLVRDFNLGIGEAETLALVLENKCEVVITDNRQGRKASMVCNLDLAGSIESIVSLYKLKAINKEKAISALKKLGDFGWFQAYLIENAREEVEND